MTIVDLDHDQHSEVLAVHLVDEGPARLSALDGQSGQVRWSTPIVAGALVPDPQPAGPPLADFNGDGVLDFALILPPATGATNRSCRVNVLSGRDGRPLWPVSFPLTPDPRNLVWPEPILGDLDGDKVPEVAVLRHSGFDDPRDGYLCELVVLDGRTGQVRWIWSWVTGFPELWPPVFIRGAGAGPGYLVLGIIQQGSVSLVALGASGTPLWKRALKIPQNRLRSGSLAWRAADLDGDGGSELIHFEDGAICVAGGPAMEVRWRWQLPAGTEALRVLSPVPSWPGHPSTLVVWAGHDVFGLDGATGRPQWRGSAPSEPLWGNSGTPDLRLVRIGRPPTPPAIQFSHRFGNRSHTVVRATWPTDADGRYLAPRR